MSFRLRDSLSGRIFLILLIGVAVAAFFGEQFADLRRIAEVRHIQASRSMERTGALLVKMQPVAGSRRLHEARESGGFIRQVFPSDPAGRSDPDLSAILQAHLPAMIRATVYSLPREACARSNVDDRPLARVRAGEAMQRVWKANVEASDCWRIDTVYQSDGSRWSFVTGPPPLLRPARGLDLGFLLVLAIATLLLAVIIARIAVAPVRALTRAAASLALDGDQPPLPEHGPGDVRVAIRAFNDMKRRLAAHAAEQTYMIAAVTHDLQTPMTRMRLKLEAMGKGSQRDRLLSDWRAMRAIVDEGLELARATHMREEAVLLDVGSLLESIVEDEVEAGHHVTFETSSGLDLRCRPQMLQRCIQNLVDNAVRYGGEARLSAQTDAQGFRIEIRDSGPGIPPDQLEHVFEPMVRLENSRSRDTGGTGLGLTIARILAARNGAIVTLYNHREGGLAARIQFAPPVADSAAV